VEFRSCARQKFSNFQTFEKFQVRVLDASTGYKTFKLQSPTPLRSDEYRRDCTQIVMLPSRDLVAIRITSSSMEVSEIEFVKLDHGSNYQKIISTSVAQIKGRRLDKSNMSFFSFSY
jgi:hypothetical protein